MDELHKAKSKCVKIRHLNLAFTTEMCHTVKTYWLNWSEVMKHMDRETELMYQTCHTVQMVSGAVFSDVS